MEAGFQELKAELGALKGTIKGEVGTLKGTIKGELGCIKSELADLRALMSSDCPRRKTPLPVESK